MLRLAQNYKYFFLVSAVLSLASITFLALWGLKLGIDFRGGTLLEVRFENQVQAGRLEGALREINAGEFLVQSTENGGFLVKIAALAPGALQELKQSLADSLGDFSEERSESVGPIIGKELLKRAYLQVVLVAAAIILYIAYAFRRVAKSSKNNALSSWKLGTATVIALIHDLLITLGVFALLGRFFGVEVDSLFVTALLTILGFSVHDTIVVFDRIRENLQNHPHKEFSALVNYSVNQTLSRSINTSSTLVFVLLAMMLFGGSSTFFFIGAILVGVISGTYSSIFIASPILILWQSKK